MPIIVDSVQTGRFYNQAGTREFAQCTAWVNFNGTGTVAIRDSLNVSSITDNGVGDYTVNFAQAMDNANYTVSGSSRAGPPTRGGCLVGPLAASGSGELTQDRYTTTSIRVGSVAMSTASNDATVVDVDSVNVAIFGGITL